MRSALPFLTHLAATATVSVSLAQAAELPPVEQLNERMGQPAATVRVYEPSLSVGDRHVAIDYVGYPAADVMARVFGKDWRSRADTVEFRALDGFVASIGIDRFFEDAAFLVFARKDGAPFTTDILTTNQTDVPLGPYYLVWDNISSPALLAEGALNWPYQVKEVNLVTLSDRALLPDGLDERHREGAELTRAHCLQCHKVNGFGGEKFKVDLAALGKVYPETVFIRLLLDPSSVRSDTTMPPLSDRLPDSERARIAKAVSDYLKAVPVLQ